MNWFNISLLLFIIFNITLARKHKLEIRNDFRRYISLSTFGFYEGGFLDVKLQNFRIPKDSESNLFGFSLDRTLSDAMNPYLDTHQDKCLLTESISQQHDEAIMFFKMDLQNKLLIIECHEASHPYVYQNKSLIPASMTVDEQSKGACPNMPMSVLSDEEYNYYNATFAVYVATEQDEGLYNLYFHSCPNYGDKPVLLDFNMEIEERNSAGFLSAGEMPLPALYFMMALLFFLSGCFWVFILKKSKHPVFKIHYLMAILVYLKAMSLMFHGVNFHFIETKGEHVATWAILYYVTHLLKGAVLFITIVLIGTGWTFIKHILADKDKKLFMIVIPLQVLANVAEIIIAESEEGDAEHRTWRDIFILVDLLCCGAILFPVVWSIRHLQEASQTDGKAAVNLRKLKLFRHFYIMIVCYIYFTRIIVYLLKITVPFEYEWLDEMFREMATFVFFVVTGYKFRPASANPYFTINTEDDEMDEVLTESGATEGLSKLTNRTNIGTTIVESHEQERDGLLSKRESSHEYD